MALFLDGQLKSERFDPAFVAAMDSFGSVLVAAANQKNSRLESAHFLMALAGIKGGATEELFGKHLSGDQLKEGVASCLPADDGAHTPMHVTEDVLGDSARSMFRSLEAFCRDRNIDRIAEPHLLSAVMNNLSNEVEELFQFVGIPLGDLRKRALRMATPVSVDKAVFVSSPDDPQNEVVNRDVFSPSGKDVLLRMKTETESLGYKEIDSRHLLLALLSFDGGATQVALNHQAISYKKPHESVMLSLRRRAAGQRSDIELSRKSMQLAVQGILEEAAKESAREDADAIAEVHILRAFLAADTFGRRMLADDGIDISVMTRSAAGYELQDETELLPAAPKGIDEIHEEISRSIVGQDKAIEQCIPLIRRMQFGFTRPGKSAGVFLFCGYSGTGKTEMARAMAKAVYGSDDDLIFLEMGQFSEKHSMSIFVGAPPGYVGYGEGKLTNGLRDKPRSVVLFDEIEKAHSEVYNALLRFLDEGRIDDPAGPVRDGSECIVILTSNVIITPPDEGLDPGDVASRRWSNRKMLRENFLKAGFRPEFLNRVDEIILFNALTKDDLTVISERILTKDAARLERERGITLHFFPDIKAVAGAVGSFCSTIDEGARVVGRVAQLSVINPVIDFLMSNDITDPVDLSVSCVSGPEGCEPIGNVSLWTST